MASPAASESNSEGREPPQGALSGLRVVEVGQWVAAPYCAALLADFGADVVKIEKPGRGDDQRQSPPLIDGDSALFMQLNRNKRSASLDLTLAHDVEALRSLASDADVFLDNYRPGVLARLGIDYETLSKANPRLIYCAISGFGLSGELSERAGMDLIAQAMSGVMLLNRDDDGRPNRVPIALADISTGLFATVGILAALQSRARTGRGQLLDLSLLDSMLAMMPMETSTLVATGENPPRFDPRVSRNAAPYQVFPTRDGWIVLVAVSQSLWEGTCHVLGCEELLADPRFATNGLRIENSRLLEPYLERVFRTRTTAEWLEKVDAARIPASPVFSLKDIVAHDHIRQRGNLVCPEPDDRHGKPVVLAPVRMSETPVRLHHAAPHSGQHTADLLQRLANGSPWLDAGDAQ